MSLMGDGSGCVFAPMGSLYRRGFILSVASLRLSTLSSQRVASSYIDVSIQDLSGVVPGTWHLVPEVASTATNLPLALSMTQGWLSLPGACNETHDGTSSYDLADYWLSGRWLPEDRPDLVTLHSMGLRSIQLQHCNMRPEAEPSLRAFLDRAWTLGLRVVLGLPERLFFDSAHGCIITEQFDCHNTVRAAYQDILDTELVEDGRYHPALEMVLLAGDHDDVSFLRRCEEAGLDCTRQDMLKLLLSSLDGMLKAEYELGVDGSDVLVSSPLSAAVARASAEAEENPCFKLRAPSGCAGQHMLRRLWAAVQDYRLANVVVLADAHQHNSTLEFLRAQCGHQKDLVSIRSAEHVLFLRDKVTEAGLDLTLPKGVPLAYDYPLMNRYFDLRNTTRDITPIFTELRARGEMTGDFFTDQTSDPFWGTDEYLAGFGWGRSAADSGISDFGHSAAIQAIICESLNNVGFDPHHDLVPVYAQRWRHTFLSSDTAEDMENAVNSIYGYVSPPDLKQPVLLLHMDK